MTAASLFSLSPDQRDMLAPRQPVSTVPSFLDPETADAELAYCGVSESDRGYVLERLPLILASEEAVAMVAGLAERVFPPGTPEGGAVTLADATHELESPGRWPDTEEANDLLGAAYLLIASSMAPLVRETHRRFSIPTDVTQATCRQVAGFCLNHKTAFSGRPGILPRQLYWLRHYPAGRLFRIGRFEYMRATYDHAGPVYRHKSYGWTVVFADPGHRVTADGRVLVRSDDGDNGSGTFVPTVRGEGRSVIGHLVTPWGVVERKRRRISTDEWELVLRPGDPVLDIHIPPGGGMYPERCHESLVGAFAFFERYFPSHGAEAVVCRSWIFNTQLERRMPDGNLAAFMRQVYLVPAYSSGNDGLFFVFCRTYDALKDYPRDTRLRRALLDVLESGETLRTTGMIYCRSELERFGGQPYRSDWPSIIDRLARSP